MKVLRATATAWGMSIVGCSVFTDLDGLRDNDASVDAFVACDASGACAAAKLPSSWTPVAYHEGFVGCPSGFVSQKYVTKPSAICTCACSVTAQPTCDVGSIPTFLGPSCTTVGATLVSDGGCITIAGDLGSSFEAIPIAPAGGACTPSWTADASTTSAEVCIPAQCGDAVCQGIVPQGYRACILSAGTVPCPSGTPFTALTNVGTSLTPECGEQCMCTLASKCETPTIAFFEDPACKVPVTTLPADQTCVDASGPTVGSAQYAATPDASCNSTGSGSTKTPFVEPHTVCCAP